MNTRIRHKGVIALFIIVVLVIASLGVVKNNQTRAFVEETVSQKKIDSLINYEIDQRVLSSDYYFMYDNIVVIDSNDMVIGKLILLADMDEIERQHDSLTGIHPTDLYQRILSGKLRIKEKE